MATTITAACPHRTRLLQIALLLTVFTVLLSLVAASTTVSQELEAHENDETPASFPPSSSSASADIEDTSLLLDQSYIGDTNRDPLKSVTATEMTPPISTSKSALASTPVSASTPGALATNSPFSPTPTTISGSNPASIITGEDPHGAPGRLSLTKPKPNQANPPLFALGSPIEFAWEYDRTTLSVLPANLTLQVTLNADATKIWPIANISGAATSYTWSTANINTPFNLLTGMYTLNIFDSKVGKLGVASGGQLISNSDLRFGLYVPGSRIPGTSKVCGTCEIASSLAPPTRHFLPFIVIGIVSFAMAFS